MMPADKSGQCEFVECMVRKVHQLFFEVGNRWPACRCLNEEWMFAYCCRCFCTSVSTECHTTSSAWCRTSLSVRADSSWSTDSYLYARWPLDWFAILCLCSFFLISQQRVKAAQACS